MVQASAFSPAHCRPSPLLVCLCLTSPPHFKSSISHFKSSTGRPSGPGRGGECIDGISQMWVTPGEAAICDYIPLVPASQHPCVPASQRPASLLAVFSAPIPLCSDRACSGPHISPECHFFIDLAAFSLPPQPLFPSVARIISLVPAEWPQFVFVLCESRGPM